MNREIKHENNDRKKIAKIDMRLSINNNNKFVRGKGKVREDIIREWICPNCGIHHDRDINASKNLLKLAM